MPSFISETWAGLEEADESDLKIAHRCGPKTSIKRS